MTWREELQRHHRERAQRHLWRQRRVRSSPQAARVIVDGRELWNFSSNDYLGLARHPDLAQAATEAAMQWGTGSGASHLVCGHDSAHQQLEESLARMMGAERALLFSTGYMANLAVPQALLQAGDLVLEDRLNHASLLDGGQASPATLKRFAHGSPAALRQRWQRWQQRHPQARLMVLSDSVFSMDGDTAPLQALAAEVPPENGLLLVDEAHGWGVLGPRGGGLWQHLGNRPEGPVLVMGTLGKAAGSFGAFVAGDAIWIEQLIQFARPYIYTTALPPTVVAATAAALPLIESPALRETLQQRIGQLLEALRASPHRQLRAAVAQRDPAAAPTPILPLIVGDEAAAVAISDQLEQQGFWVPAIRPPTVPPGTARLRLTLSAAHPGAAIEELVAALEHPQVLAHWPDIAESGPRGGSA